MRSNILIKTILGLSLLLILVTVIACEETSSEVNLNNIKTIEEQAKGTCFITYIEETPSHPLSRRFIEEDIISDVPCNTPYDCVKYVESLPEFRDLSADFDSYLDCDI